MSDELAHRVDELEATLEAMATDREQYRKQVLLPRLEQLETARDDAQADRVELMAVVESLQARVAELETELEALGGLADGESSTPKQRALDLRRALIRQARNAPDATEATMHWRQVRDTLDALGHERLSKPVYFDAMADAAGETDRIPDDTPAFWVEDDAVELNGRMARVIAVDTELLPSTGDAASGNHATTARTGTTPAETT